MAEHTYVYGTNTTREEARRLDLLEERLDPGTHEYIRRIGVRHGDRCLEVAAGGGSIALHLLSLCGKTGEVVATDVDLRWLEPIAHPRLRAVRHNIVEDDVEALGTFDFIHVRYLLSHLRTEVATKVVERLVSMLRPSGRILIEEMCRFNAVDSSHREAAVYQRAMEAWSTFFDANVGDLSFGLRVSGLLSRLGLADVHNELSTSVCRGGDVYRDWAAASTAALRGLVEERRLWDTTVDHVIELINDPSLFFAPDLRAATWGRRTETST